MEGLCDSRKYFPVNIWSSFFLFSVLCKMADDLKDKENANKKELQVENAQERKRNCMVHKKDCCWSIRTEQHGQEKTTRNGCKCK